MHEPDLLTGEGHFVGGERKTIRRPVPRGVRVALILVLALVLASQALVTQAQPALSYAIMVDSPARTNYCPKQTDSYYVHVAGAGSIGPNDPLENSYIGVGTDVTVEADVSDASVGKIVSINPMTRNSPAPDLALTDTVVFTFQAIKAGTTELNFTATVDGIQATPFSVSVRVKPCRYIVNASSKWVIPYPYGTVTITGLNKLPIKLGPDPKDTSSLALSGVGSMVWRPYATGTPCSFPDKISDGTVEIKGTVTDDGTLDLTMTYSPAAMADTTICLDRTIHFPPRTLEYEQLKFRALPGRVSPPLSHALVAPIQQAGTTTITVIEDTSNSGN